MHNPATQNCTQLRQSSPNTGLMFQTTLRLLYVSMHNMHSMHRIMCSVDLHSHCCRKCTLLLLSRFNKPSPVCQFICSISECNKRFVTQPICNANVCGIMRYIRWMLHLNCYTLVVCTFIIEYLIEYQRKTFNSNQIRNYILHCNQELKLTIILLYQLKIIVSFLSHLSGHMIAIICVSVMAMLVLVMLIGAMVVVLYRNYRTSQESKYKKSSAIQVYETVVAQTNSDLRLDIALNSKHGDI